MTENEVGNKILDAAFRLHRDLGPGLLESVYETILTNVLRETGLSVDRQVPIPICYRGMKFEEGFRADMFVENKVIVELKCVEVLNNAHKKQLLSYLRLSEMRLGFLLNFGSRLMRDGIVRTVNHLPETRTPIVPL